MIRAFRSASAAVAVLHPCSGAVQYKFLTLAVHSLSQAPMAEQGSSQQQTSAASNEQPAKQQGGGDVAVPQCQEGAPETGIPCGKGGKECLKTETAADPSLPAFAGTVTAGYCADPAE